MTSILRSSTVLEDVGRVNNKTVESGAVLPWGAPADRQGNSAWCEDVSPGEFVLRTLFAEFTVLAERKIELILSEPLVCKVETSSSDSISAALLSSTQAHTTHTPSVFELVSVFTQGQVHICN